MKPRLDVDIFGGEESGIHLLPIESQCSESAPRWLPGFTERQPFSRLQDFIAVLVATMVVAGRRAK